ncbi:MAG: ABC transporter permease [Candidatus Stahlbacteria bacterium]|nr:ABC transporter permease [Candidatus Stahlbacteria bacterium]
MKKFFAYIGDVTLFIKDFLRTLPRFYKSSNLIAEQVIFIGVASLPIVLGTTFFLGAVTAHQALFQGRDYMPDIYIGMSVIKAFMIELGPMMTAFVVGGRCGSAITAELGSMRITEQIDAIETLAIDPIRYLVMPRVIGSAIALPLLAVVANVAGCIGGGVCAIFIHHIKLITYIEGLKFHFMSHELFGGLTKALAFGIIIGLMGSYEGFRATGGTEGVGRATTRSVVSIFVLVLIFDFIIAQIVF